MKKTLGILGGGQLGRMLIQEALNFDVSIKVLDPSSNAPCKDCCGDFVQGDFKDYQTVYDFGKTVDALTFEFEHVNADALEALEKEGVTVYPQPSVLKIIQDKGKQKQFYAEHGIPTSPFKLIEDASEIDSFPIIQKTRGEGYDGKGVQVLKSEQDLAQAFNEPSVLEEMVDIEVEVAVIVTRFASGEMAVFPAVGMDFHPTANLVEFLYSPIKNLDAATLQRCEEIAKKTAEAFGIVGDLAVELFVNKQGEVLVNEVAPRPHNSGHHTIEANYTSQYEQHVRAVLDYPAGSTDVISPAVMINVLGEPGADGAAHYEGTDAVLKTDRAYLHLYGKEFTKPMRKMGHITVLGDSVEDAKQKAQEIQKHFRCTSK